MKQSKFIELLNLYVDQEISAEDAALLEAEISRNPERRKVYQQYCRMHKASAVLFDSFRSGQVPAGSTLAEASRRVDDKIAHFPVPASPRRQNWMVLGGFAAAAAALALVFVGHNRFQPAVPVDGTSPSVVKDSAAQSNSVASANGAVVPVSRRLGTQGGATTDARYQPVFVAKTFEGARLDAGELFDGQKAGSLDWMKQVQLPPLRSLSDTQFVFDTKTDLKQDARTLPLVKPVQGKVEMTAFQFQR